jgi:hypothetical protein
MRTGRAIIISVLLLLGSAGSVMAGPVMATAAGHVSTVHVEAASGNSMSPGIYYHV